jgi:hypothetical protein
MGGANIRDDFTFSTIGVRLALTDRNTPRHERYTGSKGRIPALPHLVKRGTIS